MPCLWKALIINSADTDHLFAGYRRPPPLAVPSSGAQTAWREGGPSSSIVRYTIAEPVPSMGNRTRDYDPKNSRLSSWCCSGRKRGPYWATTLRSEERRVGKVCCLSEC